MLPTQFDEIKLTYWNYVISDFFDSCRIEKYNSIEAVLVSDRILEKLRKSYLCANDYDDNNNNLRRILKENAKSTQRALTNVVHFIYIYIYIYICK